MLTTYNLKMPHAVYGGENAMDHITAIIKSTGAKRVAMFTDKGIEAAGLTEEQALKTFNMGLGMILIVNPDEAEAVEAALADAGEQTFRVGRIVAGGGEVQYANEGGLFA